MLKVALPSGGGLTAFSTDTGVGELQTSVLRALYTLNYEEPYALQETDSNVSEPSSVLVNVDF